MQGIKLRKNKSLEVVKYCLIRKCLAVMAGVVNVMKERIKSDKYQNLKKAKKFHRKRSLHATFNAIRKRANIIKTSKVIG
jgi:hypothetical protein